MSWPFSPQYGLYTWARSSLLLPPVPSMPVREALARKLDLGALVPRARMLGLVVAAEEQEDLVAAGVEEDAEQNLLLGLEQAPASLLPELPEQVFGQVLEPELVQAGAQRARVLGPEHAQERAALLEKTVHGRA